MVESLKNGSLAFVGIFEGEEDELDEHIVLAAGYNKKTDEIALLDSSNRKEFGGEFNRFGIRAVKVEIFEKMWVWSKKKVSFVNAEKSRIRPHGRWVEHPLVVMKEVLG